MLANRWLDEVVTDHPEEEKLGKPSSGGLRAHTG